MVQIKKIEEKDYQELEMMYVDYYQTLFGKDWTDKIPSEKIRNFLDIKRMYAEHSTKCAFKDKPPMGMIDKTVLGLYASTRLLGFACVGIYDDNSGGIYHLYVKPEHRKKFIGDYKNNRLAVEHLANGIIEYYDKHEVNSVALEVPHTMNSVKKIVEKYGFIRLFDYEESTKYIKER